MPSGVNYMRTVPPLHEIPDITTVAKSSKSGHSEENSKEKLNLFLADFLGKSRNGVGQSYEHKRTVDTVLVKLLGQMDSLRLEAFIKVITIK